MDWITDRIAVGNYLEAQDAGLLQEQGIVSILSLDRTLTAADATRLGLKAVEAVPLEDAAGNDPRLFRLAVEAVGMLAAEMGPVLVQCHAGRSRSAVVVAGYLMQSLGLDAEDAIARVGAKRAIAVNPALERLLEALE
ncbi:MAG TPA: dual specificity protein phosphatase [Gemmataceae bacterium]|nr:dual specificity protein phosphatase [Gemmataceae bacterium]